MKQRVMLVILASIVLVASAVAATSVSVLKSGDGKPDGKKSLGGSGEMIKFSLAAGKKKVAGISIHGSRYGYPQAPDEDFLIYILNEDLNEVLHTEMAPYRLFGRGKEKWVRVKFKKLREVPKIFWVVLDFRAARTKGVYVSYDTSTGGQYSKSGLPGLKAKDIDFDGDWMIQVQLSK